MQQAPYVFNDTKTIGRRIDAVKAIITQLINDHEQMMPLKSDYGLVETATVDWIDITDISSEYLTGEILRNGNNFRVEDGRIQYGFKSTDMEPLGNLQQYLKAYSEWECTGHVICSMLIECKKRTDTFVY